MRPPVGGRRGVMVTLQRSRGMLLVLLIVTIALGLGSRSFQHAPVLVTNYAGDVAWAVMVYWWLALVFVRSPARHIGLGALAISVLVELTQLIHTPWLDALRETRMGALVLGQGFRWSDLACYAVGAAGAVAIDRAISRVGRSTRP